MSVKNVIEQSFGQYAGAVIQSRALVNAADCLKPSARQIFYCMYTDKFTSDKPFKKTLKAVGSAARMYIHGDSSCIGVIMRAGQPFSMRYPLVDVGGSCGSLMKPGSWAAPRYTESRLSPIMGQMFKDIEKDTIEEWRDNYDDTEQYPTVLPTKGFYNIVNGTSGIATALASSIPSFNLKEVNKALTILLKNPDCDFEEIYCAPDFATGGILLNETEVKESLKNGQGKSCKLRAVIEYDEVENTLTVKELPYGVYTNTICKELEEIVNQEANCGISRFNDLTGKTPNIKIYLTKNANPGQVIKKLYKETSLQFHFGINMTMLDDGRFPRIFTWKEALQAHIDHEKKVYRRGYEFDLNKAKARLHIVDGILIALHNIDDIVHTIRDASTTIEASTELQEKFELSEIQAKAILDIKLSRLAHLEVTKFENEKAELENRIDNLNFILINEEEFNNKIIKGWEAIAKEFGDDRRTQILDIESDDCDEPIELKQLVVHLTNLNNIYSYEDSSLLARRRGTKGTKIGLLPNEIVTQTISDQNSNTLFIFSNTGKVYNVPLSEIELSKKISLSSILNLVENEQITTIVSGNKKDIKDYLVFLTKNGEVKKTEFKEYLTKRKGGIVAIKLKDGDILKQVLPISKGEKIGIGSSSGYCVIFNESEINPTARTAGTIKGIKLGNQEEAVGMFVVNNNTYELVSVTSLGNIKKTQISEFPIGSRTNKGSKFHELEKNETIAAIGTTTEESQEVVVVSTNKAIRFSLDEVRQLGRAALGTKSIKLDSSQKITGVVIN